MKIPRNIDADQLIKMIGSFGYVQTRQSGSHIRLTTIENGIHHVTIPNHRPIRVGTLNAILHDIAEHFDLTKEELLKILFD